MLIGLDDCAGADSGLGIRASRIESVADRMDVSNLFLNRTSKELDLSGTESWFEEVAWMVSECCHWIATGWNEVADEHGRKV